MKISQKYNMVVKYTPGHSFTEAWKRCHDLPAWSRRLKSIKV